MTGFLYGICTLLGEGRAKPLILWCRLRDSNTRPHHYECSAFQQIIEKFGFKSRDLAGTNEKHRLVSVRYLYGSAG